MFSQRHSTRQHWIHTIWVTVWTHKVRTPMTLLKRIWTDEDEDPEVKTLYQYVVDLRNRVEETCKMAKEELAKVQVRNQKYYNKRTRDRKLQVGDSVLLLLPTERNKLTLAWRGSYKVVGMGQLKMHDLKMQDWKMTDNISANSGQNYGVWKMRCPDI